MTHLDDLDADGYTDATLRALRRLGGSATNTILVQAVADDLGLDEAERARPYGDGSVTELYYRLGWAKTRLRIEGLIRNTGRGQWALAPRSVAKPTVKKHLGGSSMAPIQSTSSARADLLVDFREMSLPELLRMSRAILRELLDRNVVRTMNAPAGDLAEWLVARLLHGTLDPNSQKGWDLTYLRDDGIAVHVQVKARVVPNKNNRGQRQLSVFRSLDFDELVIVLFNSDLEIWRTVLFPVAVLQGLMHRNEYVNGERLMATDRFLADVDDLGGRDLTMEARELAHAALTRDHPVKSASRPLRNYSVDP